MPLPRLLAPTPAAGGGLPCDCPEPILNRTCFGARSPVDACASCPSPTLSSNTAATDRPSPRDERPLRILLIRTRIAPLVLGGTLAGVRAEAGTPRFVHQP